MFPRALHQIIHRNPTVFNCFTGGTLCAVSDAGAQKIEKTGDGFDLRRFLVAGFLGAVFGGFVYPKAYQVLDARFQGKSLPTLFTKSIVEIATVGVFVNSISMTTRGLLAGRDHKEVSQHVRKEMPSVIVNDVKVWLPYNVLAFSVISPVFRPTCTAMMEASWQTYISLRANAYSHREHTLCNKPQAILTALPPSGQSIPMGGQH